MNDDEHRTPGLSIRPVTEADIQAVVDLWGEAGMTTYASADEIVEEVTTKMARDPDLFLVGEVDGVVVATVMGTFDGHRGRIKRLAVGRDHRRVGMGGQLTAELERLFEARGITRIRLEVWAENVGGLAFWEHRGYTLEPDIRYFVHNLDGTSDPC